MRVFNKIKNDKAAANSVSFIVIIFFVMMIMVAFVDLGVYFNVKNEMQSAAENGARNVALYGGTNTTLRDIKNAKDATEVVRDSINVKFKGGTGNTSKTVEVQTVTCGPDKGISAGDKVWCEVVYNYKGLIGNKGLFGLAKSNVVVQGSSVSEVFSN